MRRCRSCGAQVPDNSLTCPQCFTPVPRRQQSIASPGGAKSGNIAMLLALLPGFFGFWGLGHIYLGRPRQGFRHLVFGLLLVGVMMLMASSPGLIFTVIFLVLLALVYLALYGYQAFETFALALALGASPPQWPPRR